MDWDDYVKARIEERDTIVRFLRRRTNHHALAQLIEDGVYLKPERDQNDYVARNKMGVLVGGK